MENHFNCIFWGERTLKRFVFTLKCQPGLYLLYCSYKTPHFYVLFLAEDVDVIQLPFPERESLSRHERSRLRCNIVLMEAEQERQQKKRERSTATTRLKRQTEVRGRRVSA